MRLFADALLSAWAGHVSCMRGRRGTYRVLMARPEGRTPLGRPRRIKMDLLEVGCGAWTGLIWLRIGTGGRLLCMRGSVKYGEFVH
jgi:hypothetical protein